MAAGKGMLGILVVSFCIVCQFMYPTLMKQVVPSMAGVGPSMAGVGPSMAGVAPGMVTELLQQFGSHDFGGVWWLSWSGW